MPFHTDLSGVERCGIHADNCRPYVLVLDPRYFASIAHYDSETDTYYALFEPFRKASENWNICKRATLFKYVPGSDERDADIDATGGAVLYTARLCDRVARQVMEPRSPNTPMLLEGKFRWFEVKHKMVQNSPLHKNSIAHAKETGLCMNTADCIDSCAYLKSEVDANPKWAANMIKHCLEVAG